MTKRLFFHVGAPKSGTTYLQAVLEGNRVTLADQGVLVVGRRVQRVHAAMAIREDSRLAGLPPEAGQAWDRLVAEILAWPGRDAILSYELFAAASAEKVERALAKLTGVEVHVVVTARDLARALPSAWQERLKFALTTPLEQFAPDRTMGARAQWGYRTMDPAEVTQRWGASLPPGQVHVVTMPRTSGDRHEFWHRFAEACGLSSASLQLDQERVNESMGVVEAELLRRVNEQLGGRIKGNREESLWLRDLLAHEVLAGMGREPIGISDEQFAEASQRSAAGIEQLEQAGYQVHGDLEDLRATRPEGRLPSEVLEGELVESAVEAIVRLLTITRDRTRAAEAARVGDLPPGPGPDQQGSRLRRAVVAASAPVVETRRRQLERRVAQMEAELREARAMHQRLAELGDLVEQLLLPALDQDGLVLEEAVKHYRRDNL